MKRRDEIKLDALSGINDEIIERNTIKREKLLEHPRVKRSVLISTISSAAACLAIVISLLITLFGQEEPTITPPPITVPGQVPVYQGMTISNSFSALDTASYANGENPSTTSVNDINILSEEEINNALTFAGSKEEVYYATQGEEIYITVHISNPDQYEILSFTLNGKTYSSYMFEEGSDMENLVLKVNVGTTLGIKEYSIDTIKYVDDTEIKDVRMEGDRTVAVSVGNGTDPSAMVLPHTTYHSISFHVYVSDYSGLVDYYGKKIFVILTDADGNLIEATRVNNNAAIVQGLTPSTEYHYSIIAIYKAKDDPSPKIHTVSEGEAKTLSGLASLSASISKSSEGHDLTLSAEANSNAVIKSAKILLAGSVVKEIDVSELVATGSTVLSASDLLYSHTYTFAVNYKMGDSEYTDSVNFTTPTLETPTVVIRDVSTVENVIEFNVKVTNPSLTATRLTVDLYLDGAIVDSYETLVTTQSITIPASFSGIDTEKGYTLVATLEYDLRDGKGTKSTTCEWQIVIATDMVMRSEPTLTVGEKLLLQITLSGAEGANIDTIVLNGVKYSVNDATSNDKILNLEIDTSLIGSGIHVLVLDALMSGDKTIASDTGLFVTLSVKADMSYIGIDIVSDNGTEYEAKSVFNYGEELYIRIKLKDADGCTLTSVTVLGESNTSSPEWVICEDVIKLDTNTWLIPLSSVISYTDQSSVSVCIDSFNYLLDGESKTMSVWGYGKDYTAGASILPKMSGETRYVYTIEDFKNMDDGYHYVLGADIDLGGSNWTPVVFNGSFNGNGYKVKNLTYVANTADDVSHEWGLFSSADGLIYNLQLEGVYVSVDHTFTDGCFIGYSVNFFGTGTHNLYNCSFDSSSSVTITARNRSPQASEDQVRTTLTVFSGVIIDGCKSDMGISVTAYMEGGITLIDSGNISNCKLSGSAFYKGSFSSYITSSALVIPSLDCCENTMNITVEDARVSIGGELILGDHDYLVGGIHETYRNHPSAKITFENGGYIIVIEYGNYKIEYLYFDAVSTIREYKRFNNSYTLCDETVDGVTTYDPVMLDGLNFEIYFGGITLSADGTHYVIESVIIDAHLSYSNKRLYDAVIIYIPSEYDGLPVYAIGSIDYRVPVPDSCLKDGATVKLIIGDGIKQIGETEYAGVDFMCGGINELYIPASVEVVGEKALYNRCQLTKVYCEATQQPEGFAPDWIADDVTVEWGAR